MITHIPKISLSSQKIWTSLEPVRKRKGTISLSLSLSLSFSLSFCPLSAIFQLHFIYHNLLTLIYRYTAARHICMRHRNLHWPSLNVTVLLNDRSTGPRTVFRNVGPPDDGNSMEFSRVRATAGRFPTVRPSERYTPNAIRLSKNSAFCNGNRFHRQIKSRGPHKYTPLSTFSAQRA